MMWSPGAKVAEHPTGADRQIDRGLGPWPTSLVELAGEHARLVLEALSRTPQTLSAQPPGIEVAYLTPAFILAGR